MRKLWFVLLVAGVLTGCSKDDGAENGNDLPALPDPNDVCSAMNDLSFMAYCYENFDVNKNGKVSVSEAEAVREIRVSAQSIKGIERFPNLETLYWYNLMNPSPNLDSGSVLCYNKKLKYIGLFSSSFSVTDLSPFQRLDGVYLNGRFGTVLLPQTIQSMDLYQCRIEILKCYAVTPPELRPDKSLISTVYVPEELVAVYKAAYPWTLFDIQPL